MTSIEWWSGWLVMQLLSMRDLWELITGDPTARLAIVVFVVALAFLLQLLYVAWRMAEQIEGIPRAPKDYEKHEARR